MDSECWERYSTFLGKKKWFAAPLRRTIPMDDGDWKDLFNTPQLPPAAVDKLTASGAMDRGGVWRDPVARAVSAERNHYDQVCRSGMQFSSVLLMIAELFSRAVNEDEATLERRDIGQLVRILAPLSRLVFDQFARGQRGRPWEPGTPGWTP